MRKAFASGFLLAMFGMCACEGDKPIVYQPDQWVEPTPQCIELPECTGGGKVVLAMDKIFIGDTNPSGKPNPANGWKQYGFNLDGWQSTKYAQNLCQPSSGGSYAAVYPDGNDGIDNSFGKNVLPIWLGAESHLGEHLQARLDNGVSTYMITLDDIGQGEACSTRTTLLLGASRGTPPLWDGSDTWPVDPESLKDPADPTSAKVVLGTTNLVDGVLTTCEGVDFDWVLTFAEPAYTFHLPIHHARFQMQLDPNGGSATSGILGGIVDREELVAEVAELMKRIDPGGSLDFCDPQSPTLLSILNQIRQAADIMRDGSQDPDKECDGISIGLGFTMKRVELGDVGTSPTQTPDPCKP